MAKLGSSSGKMYKLFGLKDFPLLFVAFLCNPIKTFKILTKTYTISWTINEPR